MSFPFVPRFQHEMTVKAVRKWTCTESVICHPCGCRYQNEEQTGQAIAAAGLKREELWVTTKFSGRLG